jgi:hypothetical protein
MNKDSTRRVFEDVDESFRKFGVLPLQLPSTRHSWCFAIARLDVLEFSSCIVTFIRHGAYEALEELTAFSTRSMRNAADNGALGQSIKNLLASG